MRLVLDTNVVVSGLIWNAPPRRLLDLAASGDIALFSSTVLLEELAGVLERRKFAASLASRGLTATFLTQRYGAVTTLVFPARADRTVPTDADDDHVIAAAVHANLDGDGNLLKEDDITEKRWLLLNDLYTAHAGAGKNTPPTLLKQLANRWKLTAQLPLRRGRRRNLVLCPKSGDIMRAARTHAGSAVADDTLYWYEAQTSAEAAYLTILLNTNCLQHAFTSAKESGRDFHLHPWRKVPIPRYDETDPLHREIAGLCTRAEKIATMTVDAELKRAPNREQPSLSKAVREALTDDGIDAEMDDCARQLLPDQATERTQ